MDRKIKTKMLDDSKIKTKMLYRKRKTKMLYRKRKIIIGIILIFSFFINGANADILEANNSCVNCHKTVSPSVDIQFPFNNIIINHTERNVSCSIDCHKDVMKKKVIDNFQQWSESSHASYFVTCDQCHGGNPKGKSKEESHVGVLNSTDLNSSIYFVNIPETCGKCHTEELKHFENTMHYQRLKAESLAPSCITCHSPHTFQVPTANNIIPVCSRCHNPINLPTLSSVPNDAKDALDKVKEIQVIVASTKKNISDAKALGKDVSNAQFDLDNAISITDSIPLMWHGFDLKNFDQQIQVGINYAEKAQSEVRDIDSSVPKASDIPIEVVLLIFILVYWIIKKG